MGPETCPSEPPGFPPVGSEARHSSDVEGTTSRNGVIPTLRGQVYKDTQSAAASRVASTLCQSINQLIAWVSAEIYHFRTDKGNPRAGL